MGSTNDAVPQDRPRELKMHDCLIEVTNRESGQSAVFWLGGYVRSEMRINPDGRLDPAKLSYEAFEHDLMDHFDYDSDEEELRWDRTSAFKSAGYPGESSVFLVRTYNTWVAALLAMEKASLGRVNSDAQPASTVVSTTITARLTIVRRGT
ncbi:hypothetical protein N7519_011575 [Penicillium mononematosum]|uniref:uncharacterized protein n=1 Tax=Penicillium mononematosum TaxID=268346 RepID=UPI00254803EB|nr:uncharacterized protein N7519_011575 [Penicillium mononematosum]KAJ6181114.1 hypothetical protein N7519_011575 [Penicillium mononematosum]